MIRGESSFSKKHPGAFKSESADVLDAIVTRINIEK